MLKLEQQFTVQYSFPVYFIRDVFDVKEQLLASLFLQAGKKQHKILCIADSKVIDTNPSLVSRIKEYGTAHHDVMQLCGKVMTVPGGEICKSGPGVVESMIRKIHDHHLCRQSFIIAIGGGAVLDAAGYAAATSHRGIRLIRIPTTVLAQNDAGVGVKNGINALGRKNFLGTFAPPFAVINDFAFLDTLSPRELRAGLAEAVKVALIKDRSFFNFLFNERHSLATFDQDSMEKMIHQCAALHMDHIGTQGDPFEFGSARPLDFGHWSAHKLEEMTGSMISHGEAVSVGIALDSLYSFRKGMIEENELQQIFVLLRDLELPMYHPALIELDVPAALHEFQEHLGGELAITLLTGIGTSREKDWIDTDLMVRCIQELALKFTGRNSVEERKSGNLVHMYGMLN